jgi:glycosyltransferase involved in cell wall biosynthesis
MIDKNPLVSVLMTAYNREIYISEAIESVLASSFKDFELIIVDDCSKDNTVEIARKYEELDSRIKVYINEVNLGDYPNRNKAASYASGKYLKYLDSDDMMSPKCIEVMVNQMELHPDCAFGISSRVLNQALKHSPESAYRVHFFERGILDLGPSASIIRNDIFKKENGFWKLRCVSDFEFWFRIAQKYAVLELEKDLIFWRQHEEQEINLGSLEYLEHSLNIVTDKLNDCELKSFEKQAILKKYRKGTSRQIIKSTRQLGILKTINLWRTNHLSFLDLF